MKLDDAAWQNDLIGLGRALQPRLFVFDPLARMKAASRNESSQDEMATLIEFLRELREDSGAAVAFVHHVGHAGSHMRGSSDLESVWETRLTWTRDGQALEVSIKPEHREAESDEPIKYRVEWDHEDRSMRLELSEAISANPLETLIGHIRDNPNQRTDEIREALKMRRSWLVRDLEELERRGTIHAGPSGRRDKAGRAIHDKAWNLSNQAGLSPVPNNGTTQDEPQPGTRGSVARPTPLRGDGPDEPHGHATQALTEGTTNPTSASRTTNEAEVLAEVLAVLDARPVESSSE